MPTSSARLSACGVAATEPSDSAAAANTLQWSLLFQRLVMPPLSSDATPPRRDVPAQRMATGVAGPVPPGLRARLSAWPTWPFEPRRSRRGQRRELPSLVVRVGQANTMVPLEIRTETEFAELLSDLVLRRGVVVLEIRDDISGNLASNQLTQNPNELRDRHLRPPSPQPRRRRGADSLAPGSAGADKSHRTDQTTVVVCAARTGTLAPDAVPFRARPLPDPPTIRRGSRGTRGLRPFHLRAHSSFSACRAACTAKAAKVSVRSVDGIVKR